jgi:hypothetical protein
MAKCLAWLFYALFRVPGSALRSRLRSPFQAPLSAAGSALGQAPLSVPGSALRARIGSRLPDRLFVQNSALQALPAGFPYRLRFTLSRLQAGLSGLRDRLFVAFQALGSRSPFSALDSSDRRFFRGLSVRFFPAWLKTIAKRVIPNMPSTPFATRRPFPVPCFSLRPR